MANNVIRQFLVGLGWDIDVQGMNRFASTIATQTEAVRELAEGIKGGARAVVDFVRSGVEGLDNLYFASIRTKSSVGTLQALKYAAEQTGLPFEQLKGNLIGFRNWLDNYGSGAEAWLHGLGVNARDASGKLRDLTLVYREAVKAALARPNAVAYLNQLGIDRASAEALASPAADRYFAERQKMASASGTDEQQAAEDANKLEAATRQLSAAMDVLREKTILGLVDAWNQLSPATRKTITDFFDLNRQIERLMTWWHGLSDNTRTAIKWMIGAGTALGGLSVAVGTARGALALFGPAIEVIGGVLGAVISPEALPIIAAIAAVAALAWAFRDKLKPALSETWDWLKKVGAGIVGFGHSAKDKAAALLGGKNAPRGIRNNNPGNIEAGAFADAQGSTGREAAGRFAVFANAQGGLNALGALLHSYARRGIDSVRAIISKYAPASENNTAAYIASVAKKLGVDANAHLDLSDPRILSQMERAIVQFENGRNPYSAEMYAEAARSALGAKDAGREAAPVQITQHVTTTVTGADSAHDAADALTSSLRSANGLLVRSLQNRTS